ncbi:hypothetical protein CR513_05639, partial [Mucuna pruriens]
CWGGQLKGQWRRAFERKHENLLSLVNIEVQPRALCFTFQGFQLTPTLEEYERLGTLSLLGLSGQITQGARVRSVKVEENLERSGRDPGIYLGREAPMTSGRRRLADLHGRVRALGLWHNALSPNRTLCRFGRHRHLSQYMRPRRAPYCGSLGRHLLYFGLLQ